MPNNQIKNVSGPNGDTTVQETIKAIDKNHQQNSAQIANLIENLVNLRNGDNRFIAVSSQISNMGNSQEILDAISQDDYRLYNSALENGSSNAVEFLSEIVFAKGGKKAIDSLMNNVINNYFVNPDCDENNLAQVAQTFIPAINKAGIKTDLQDLKKRIESQNDLTAFQKDQSIARTSYVFPKEYKQLPEKNPSKAHANQLQQTYLTH